MPADIRRIAVLLPCYNEEAAVTRVVTDFRAALPNSDIFVFDNASTDATKERAVAAGANVRQVERPGKGNVVRRMFADIDADIYILADGDATYHAASASQMMAKLIDENLDMVVGARVSEKREAYRTGHEFGNRLLTGTMSKIFGGNFRDMLSGYRVLSRRFVKSFPAMSHGFEIETELTIHALELRMPCAELFTPYGIRLEGSSSKLRTFSDGLKILSTIFKLFAIERPLRFYGALAGFFAAISALLSIPLFATYVATGLVPRFPTAVLSTGIGLFAIICFFTGLILENITIGRRETKRLHYLSIGIRGN